MARGRNLSFNSARVLEVSAPAPRIETCVDCGSVIFTSIAGRCGDCQESRLEDIQKVRDFVSANGARPPWEVMRQTGVSSSLIMSLLKGSLGSNADAPDALVTREPAGPLRPPRMYTRPHALRRQAE